MAKKTYSSEELRVLSLLKSYSEIARMQARHELIVLTEAYVKQADHLVRQTEKRKGPNWQLWALIHATVHNVLLHLLKQMIAQDSVAAPTPRKRRRGPPDRPDKADPAGTIRPDSH